MARVSDLVAAFEHIAPVALAEPWDNVGLVIGDARAPLTRVLLAVDLSPDVIDEAVAHGCDAVVAYHPPIFAPHKRLGPTDLAYHAVRAGLAVYSPHTALDVAEGGTNDALCDVLGLFDRRPLKPRGPEGPGLGRIGRLPVRSPARAIVDLVKVKLRLRFVLAAGPLDREVETVAVCAGAGGSLVDDASREGAELYLVGELGHHDALRAARVGLTALCTLHSHTERLALPALAARLRQLLPGVEAEVSTRDRDPFELA